MKAHANTLDCFEDFAVDRRRELKWVFKNTII
jgi:hypothetical protein